MDIEMKFLTITWICGEWKDLFSTVRITENRNEYMSPLNTMFALLIIGNLPKHTYNVRYVENDEPI